MTEKPMSWAVAGLLLLTMITGTIVLDMAFSSSLRHQFLSIHSDFWEIAVPGNLIGDAILVTAMRAIFNWRHSSRKNANLESHQVS
jgi:hypothetical protein